MRARVLTMLALTALFGAVIAAPPAGARSHKKSVRLKQFKTCPSLIKYGIRHRPPQAPQTVAKPSPMQGGAVEGGGNDGSAPTPTSAPAPAAQDAPERAPVAGDDFSTTNVQEQGVDEPDVIKTDGKIVYAVNNGVLRAVDVTGAPKVLDALKLGENGYNHALLMHGDRMLVSWTTGYAVPMYAAAAQVAPTPAPMPYYAQRPTLVLGLVDISDPEHLKLTKTLTLDGNLIDSRLTGSTARVVLGTTPRAIVEATPTTSGGNTVSTGPGQDRKARIAAISPKRAAAWLPKGKFVNRRTHKSRTRAIVHCRATRHPASFSGLDMITVLTIDLDKGLDPVDSDALMTSGDMVYASQKNLYVASQRYMPQVWSETSGELPPSITTQIHKFDISDADATHYIGSGSVPGFLLNQFSMSENEGVLRVASTAAPTWFEDTTRAQNASFVTTLKEAGGTLAPLGQVGGLGAGERIYAVRFLGDAGYVVTFRQIDPLYTLDLSKPNDPKVAGELKMLGYSAYLHPAGDGLLIGVGQDAGDTGRTSGTKLALYDVSDLAHPAVLQSATVGGGSSQAEYDHHAFLWWPKTDLAVFPINIYDNQPRPVEGPNQPSTAPSQPFSGAIGFTVKRTGITEKGRIQHPQNGYGATIDRSVVIGESIYTLSAIGLKKSDLATFADQAFVTF